MSPTRRTPQSGGRRSDLVTDLLRGDLSAEREAEVRAAVRAAISDGGPREPEREPDDPPTPADGPPAPWDRDDPRWPKDEYGPVEACPFCGGPAPVDAPEVVCVSGRHVPRGAGTVHDGPCGEAECADLAKDPTPCEFPGCGRRDPIWCYGDAWSAHRGCLPRCAEPGCRRVPVRGGPRCEEHRRDRARELTRERVRRLRERRNAAVTVPHHVTHRGEAVSGRARARARSGSGRGGPVTALQRGRSEHGSQPNPADQPPPPPTRSSAPGTAGRSSNSNPSQGPSSPTNGPARASTGAPGASPSRREQATRRNRRAGGG